MTDLLDYIARKHDAKRQAGSFENSNSIAEDGIEISVRLFPDQQIEAPCLDTSKVGGGAISEMVIFLTD